MVSELGVDGINVSTKKYLIVNADDLGYYKAADEGIIKAAKDGIITSATVVVNMPRAEKLPEAMKKLPALSLGLHFNLTHGKPLHKNVTSLTGNDAFFCHTADALCLKASPEDIACELRAQFNFFQKLFGRAPTHIDSHKHIHRKKNVLEALVSVARENKLPVRSNSPYVHFYLKSYNVATTNYFIGDVSVDAYWKKEKLLKTLKELPEGVTELMCHPGFADKSGEYIGFYNAQREGELAALCDDEILQVIQEEGIQLINFNDIMKSEK